MVHLKSIHAHGFKSFAEPTQIDFDKGVTAIVGPNGSGKSNITDAIKWVLGEQSARSLRGSKMEDVIFSGAKHRNAQNFAEVQLKLDNQKGLLNVESEEVTITRRLYRNGDSVFFLNNERQRLKDITELFLDSGLGKEAFSIISQGRVDEVLNAKPTERRHIIEETAGVLKYKKRKEASVNKLSQTEANLTRVEDILYDLEGRVEPLKEEAAIAKEYMHLSEALKESDIQVTVYDITAYQQEISTLDQKLNDLKGRQAKVQSQKSSISKLLQKTKGQRFDLDQQLEDLNINLIQVTEKVEQLNGKYQLLEERQKNQSQMNARIEEEQESLNHERTSTQEEIQSVQSQIEKLKHQREKLITNIQQLESQIYRDDANSDAEIEQLKDTYYQYMTEQSNLNNDIRFLSRTIEEHQKKQNRLDTRLQEAYNELKTAQHQMAEIKKQKDSKLKERDRIQIEIERTEQQLSEAQRQQTETEEKLYQAYRYYDKLKSRLEVAQSKQQDMTYYYQGVKSILKSSESFDGVHGAVAQKLNVPSQYTTAIEVALGATLQHVIVEDEHVARQAIQYLKTKQSGRATFLPLSVIKPKHLDPQIIAQAKQHEGYIAIASDLVTYDAKYQSIAENLLGRTIIVDHLKTANEVANAIRYKTRIVTLEGDIVNPGGAMTGGRKAHQQSVLGHKHEYERLTQQLDTYTRQIKQLEAFCSQKKEEKESYSDTYLEQQHQFNQLKQALHDLDLEYDRYSKIEQQLKRDHEEFQFEKNDGYNANESQNTLLTKQQRKAEIDDTLQSLDRQIKQLTEQNKHDKTELQKHQNRLHQYKSDLAVTKEKLSTQQANLKRYTQQMKQIDKQQSQLNDQLDLINSDEVNDDTALTKISEEIEAFREKKKHLLEQQETFRHERQSIEDLIESNEKALEKSHQSLLELENQYQNVKTSQSRLDVLIDQNLKHLDEKYHMTFEYAHSHFSNLNLEIDQLRQKVKLTQLSIDELGPVNLKAIEQYEEIQERYDFLLEQRNDLREAKETLEQIIHEMDKEVVERFSATFNAIKTQFENVFKTLFEGGQAELELTDNDYLTAGIEIKVQPPGKKLQHLSLLSGGERALSAIALLFAILKVRSAPFVILDEVEAALDETNVTRYANYLKTLSEATQFIVITHRKGTMEMCDRLYGVTMQELGVSRLVSVNLNTIDKMLEED
ncbi:chromosome segregation protein SMC [Staphylococcus canis]|uniref:Chromosome partition protein Smc n=1 Tax=Staphylococcus canis TaxID=2724942 RepID=A0ABS0T762_9STAP|nr:chromosome segregation protein SMC [Staphylococcus canis]MBI5974581.1 chromosome segregation protein SMC [Staphylococcus canis]